MNITIFGATGQVGRRLVDEATTRGHQVTAVTGGGQAPGRPRLGHMDRRRRPEWPDVTPPRPRPGHRNQRDIGTSSGGNELAVTAQALLDRIADTDARLIVVGGAGPLIVPTPADASSSTTRFVPASIRGVAQACVDQLDALRQDSTVAWTYFSPSAQMTAGQRTDSSATGTNELIVDGDGASRISLEDVAVAVLDEASNPGTSEPLLTAATRSWSGTAAASQEAAEPGDNMRSAAR